MNSLTALSNATDRQLIAAYRSFSEQRYACGHYDHHGDLRVIRHAVRRLLYDDLPLEQGLGDGALTFDYERETVRLLREEIARRCAFAAKPLPEAVGYWEIWETESANLIGSFASVGDMLEFCATSLREGYPPYEMLSWAAGPSLDAAFDKWHAVGGEQLIALARNYPASDEQRYGQLLLQQCEIQWLQDELGRQKAQWVFELGELKKQIEAVNASLSLKSSGAPAAR